MSIAWFIFVTLFVIGLQSYIYSKWGLSRIEYTRSFSEVAVFEGEEIIMIDEIANKKILPIPWLRLEAKINENLQFKGQDQTENKAGQDHSQRSEIIHGNYHRMLFSLLPYQKIRRKQHLICTKRGFYHFENVDLSTGDVFGFGEDSKHVQSPAEIIVYPSLLSMDDIPLPTHSWLGDVVVRRWIIEDPFLAAGVREYSAGDPLNSINWKATARTNQLQVTKKGFSADHHLMIYVNFNQTGDIWYPIVDQQLTEKSISYAATIAEFSISKGISTGFGCNSYIGQKTNETIRIEAENSRQQLTYILETLAKIELDANKSIHSFLREDIDQNIEGQDILIITAFLSDEMTEIIRRIEELGNSVEVLMLESELVNEYRAAKEGENMSVFRDIIIKVFQGIFEYLLLLPILMMIGINIIDHTQLPYWLLYVFGLFIVGVVFRSLLFSQKWWLFSLFSIIVGSLSSFIFANDSLFVIVLSLIHIWIVYRGMMYASQTWEHILPLSFLWVGGLGIYFASYFIFRFVESLNPYLNYITIFGVILIVMTMFVSNSDQLRNATLSKDKKPFVSRTIKNQNRIYLIFTILAIALITNGQMIRDGLWNGFRAVIRWFFGFLTGTEEVIEEETPTPLPSMEEFPFEVQEPSVIAKFLEMIFMYVAYIVLGVVVILLLFSLSRRTRIWIKNGFRKIIQFLKEIVSRVTERDESIQYTEEKESVFEWQEWKDEQQSKAKAAMQNIFKRKPSWNSLSNQEKVRFVYRHFILQEIDLVSFKDDATPREILEKVKLTAQVDERQIEQLIMAYEQTRYGEQDIDEQIITDIYKLIAKK